MSTTGLHMAHGDGEHAKHVITRPSANANMFLNSADRLTSTSVPGFFDPTSAGGQPLNDFRLQKPSAISSGLFTRGMLTEIRFPYACPNVNPRNNSFYVGVRETVAPFTEEFVIVTIAEGYYTGTELAAAIQLALNAGGLTIPIPTIAYNSTPNTFTISATGTTSIFLLPYDLTPGSTTGRPFSNLLNVMGYNYQNIQTSNYAASYTSGYAPLTYTQYVDVVSIKMTTYQEVKDVDSSVAGKNDLVMRIYIADEMSLFPQTSIPGTRPFLIHRQFKTPKTLRWNPEAFLDFVDLRLLDQFGQPLYTPAGGLPDYQITMLLSED